MHNPGTPFRLDRAQRSRDMRHLRVVVYISYEKARVWSRRRTSHPHVSMKEVHRRYRMKKGRQRTAEGRDRQIAQPSRRRTPPESGETCRADSREPRAGTPDTRGHTLSGTASSAPLPVLQPALNHTLHLTPHCHRQSPDTRKQTCQRPSTSWADHTRQHGTLCPDHPGI